MSSESLDNQLESSVDFTPEDRNLETRSPISESVNSESDLSNSVNKECLVNRTLSWHEHVYKKITNRPTPHYIENILGIQKQTCYNDTDSMTVSKQTPTETLPKIVAPVQELNEPLNLSVRNSSDVKVRTKTVKGKLCLNICRTCSSRYKIQPQTSSCFYFFTSALFIINTRKNHLSNFSYSHQIEQKKSEKEEERS